MIFRALVLFGLFIVLVGCGKREHWSEREAVSHLTEKKAYDRARAFASLIPGCGVAPVTDTSDSMGHHISSYSYVLYERDWEGIKEDVTVVMIKPTGGFQCHRALRVKGDMILTAGTNNERHDEWLPKSSYMGNVFSYVLHER